MKEIEFIKKLDAASPPAAEIDVANRVMWQIRRAQIRAVESSPMWIGALLSTVAAAAVLLLAFQAFAGLQDPFGDLLTPLLTAFQ